MKHIYTIFKQLLFILSLGCILPLQASITLSDNFESNALGWVGSQGISIPGNGAPTQELNLTRKVYNYKIYKFGSNFANTSIRVQFDLYALGGWEANDFVYLYDTAQKNDPVTAGFTVLNFPTANGVTEPLYRHIDFNTTTDASGEFILYINPYQSNAQTEFIYLDNVTITTLSSPPSMNPIPTMTFTQYIFSSIDLSQYVSQPDANDSILSYNYTCPGLNGLTLNANSGLISGNPISIGNFSCTASATDKDGTSNSVNFNIQVTKSNQAQPPVVNPIPDISFVVNTPFTLDLSTYTIPTDGDKITEYKLGGTLFAGLNFDKKTGIISGQSAIEGNTTLSFTAKDKDGSSNTSSFVLSIIPSVANGGTYRKFHLRYQQTFKGKMYTIGNTILVAPGTEETNKKIICKDYNKIKPSDNNYISNATKYNSDYILCTFHADAKADFPTTQATLPPSKDVNASIKWAGLYWQSLVKNNTVDLSKMQIQIRHSNAKNYTPVQYTVLDFIQDTAKVGYTSYNAFADVTSYFKDNNFTSGDIFIGNIPVVEGQVKDLGTYGAWTLVVIYEDNQEKLQNFSIYDGWQKVGPNNPLVDITINGFYTPKNPLNGIIDAQISVFTAEGDKLIPGDELKVKPSKSATFTTLTTFDSSINVQVPPLPLHTLPRIPNPINNQGIDIQEFPLGNIISPEESSMTLQFTSKPNLDAKGNPISQDLYFPSLVAFSAELYPPKLCYDYTVSMGDNIRVLPSDTRDINSSTYGGLPLKIEFLIHSEEADFTYFDTKSNIVFTNQSSTLTYNNTYVKMSPANANIYFTYLQHPEIESNATKGQINLGENIILPTNNAFPNGILTPKQSTYGVIGYDVAKNQKDIITTRFDIEVEAKIQFDPLSVPVTFNFSSATNTQDFSRCKSNPTYNPIQLGFNVERPGIHKGDFRLFTQVTGRPYAVDVVAYEGGVNAASDTPLSFTGTVELELIDGGAFDNNSSAGYDTTCQRPDSIGTGTFVRFNPNEPNVGRHTVQIPADFPGYINNKAVKNAAFRLWVVTVPDINNTRKVIVHDCNDSTNSDGCFNKLYNTKIDVNNTGSCVIECGSKASVTNPLCYTCIKTYYATPICSRDNFAIRPDSFYVSIADDNYPNALVVSPSLQLGDNTKDTSAAANALRPAAGYDYLIDSHTVTTDGKTKTLDYYNKTFLFKDNIKNVPNIYTAGSLAMIEFNDSPSCYDKNQSTIALTFKNSMLNGTNYFRFQNAGKYNFWLSDSNWTIVDHVDYIYKPYPGSDCDENSTNSAVNTLAGCTFTSYQAGLWKIHANVQPYHFSMSKIPLVQHPDLNQPYTFYNDFNSSYYNANNISTSTSYVGLLIAQGRSGDITGNKTLSNFTKSCAAQDVILDLNITTNPSNANTITPLQQYLQHTQITNVVGTARSEGIDANITLTKQAFPDTQTTGDGVTIKPGEARILLHTTFNKPKNGPVNPILVSYKGLNSASTLAWSRTNMQTHYIPTGKNNKSKDIIYYFAKVTPSQTLYDNVTSNDKITPLFTNIYCDLIDCNTQYNLATPAHTGEPFWYAASMYKPLYDGNITALNVARVSGVNAVAAVTPNLNIPLKDLDGSRSDVNVSIAGPGRPVTIETTISLPPWLSYNPLRADGYPTYRVRFISPGSWLGVGNTGSVVDTQSSTTATRRMNW